MLGRRRHLLTPFSTLSPLILHSKANDHLTMDNHAQDLEMAHFSNDCLNPLLFDSSSTPGPMLQEPIAVNASEMQDEGSKPATNFDPVDNDFGTLAPFDHDFVRPLEHGTKCRDRVRSRRFV